MGKPKPDPDAIYIATESFHWTAPDGQQFSVSRDETRVRGDHPLVAACPDYFKPMGENLSYAALPSSDDELAEEEEGDTEDEPAENGDSETQEESAEDEETEEGNGETEEGDKPQPVDPKLTKPEVVELAKAEGIENPAGNKKDIIAAIEEARAVAASETGE